MVYRHKLPWPYKQAEECRLTDLKRQRYLFNGRVSAHMWWPRADLRLEGVPRQSRDRPSGPLFAGQENVTSAINYFALSTVLSAFVAVARSRRAVDRCAPTKFLPDECTNRLQQERRRQRRRTRSPPCWRSSNLRRLRKTFHGTRILVPTHRDI